MEIRELMERKVKIGTSIAAGVMCAVILIMAGCSQPVESTARDGIAAASAFLNNENAIYKESCTAAPQQTQCVALSKASHSVNVAIDALEAYCAGPQFNTGSGTCNPPTDANAKNQLSSRLSGTLADLNRDIGDVKKLVSPTPTSENVPRQQQPIQAGLDGNGIIALLTIILPLLQGFLAQLKAKGAPQNVVDSLEQAILKLQEVHNTPLTKDQLESFRVEVPWEKSS